VKKLRNRIKILHVYCRTLVVKLAKIRQETHFLCSRDVSSTTGRDLFNDTIGFFFSKFEQCAKKSQNIDSCLYEFCDK
jgi:hypothetical protein